MYWRFIANMLWQRRHWEQYGMLYIFVIISHAQSFQLECSLFISVSLDIGLMLIDAFFLNVPINSSLPHEWTIFEPKQEAYLIQGRSEKYMFRSSVLILILSFVLRIFNAYWGFASLRKSSHFVSQFLEHHVVSYTASDHISQTLLF